MANPRAKSSTARKKPQKRGMNGKPKPKKRRRLFAKLMLALGYAMVIVFLGALFIIYQELRRVGFFARKTPIEAVQPQPKTAVSARTKRTLPPKATSAPATVEDITPEEKQALEEVLRRK